LPSRALFSRTDSFPDKTAFTTVESPDLSVTTGIFIVLNTRESKITPSLTSLRFIVTCVPFSVSLTNQEEYDADVTVKGFECRVLNELQLMMNRLIRRKRMLFCIMKR
jgi:hypothetical protein